jgi:eukaryotic-like serine/threonine-protein kinase
MEVIIEIKIEKGYVIAGYMLEGMLGSGGFATVYKARSITPEPIYDTIIAIKILHPRRLEKQQIRMFKEEMNMLMYLEHPNILKVYTVKSQDGHYFALMEFLDTNLLTAIRTKQEIFNQQNVLSIISQIASGLNYIHKNGYIHKDVNPTNILISYSLDKIKISDFGLAGKKGFFNKGLSSTGGTAGYIAPERKQHFSADIKTDIYSFGKTIQKIYSELNFEIPDKVKYVIEVSTKENRDERFFDMKELLYFLSGK